MTHTPGPWKAKFEKRAGYDCMTDGWVISDKDSFDIVTVDVGDYDGRKDEAEANAYLIAAAPDMLLALKMCKSLMDRNADLFDDEYARGILKHTILKAEGKQ